MNLLKNYNKNFLNTTGNHKTDIVLALNLIKGYCGIYWGRVFANGFALGINKAFNKQIEVSTLIRCLKMICSILTNYNYGKTSVG